MSSVNQLAVKFNHMETKDTNNNVNRAQNTRKEFKTHVTKKPPAHSPKDTSIISKASFLERRQVIEHLQKNFVNIHPRTFQNTSDEDNQSEDDNLSSFPPKTKSQPTNLQVQSNVGNKSPSSVSAQRNESKNSFHKFSGSGLSKSQGNVFSPQKSQYQNLQQPQTGVGSVQDLHYQNVHQSSTGSSFQTRVNKVPSKNLTTYETPSSSDEPDDPDDASDRFFENVYGHNTFTETSTEEFNQKPELNDNSLANLLKQELEKRAKSERNNSTYNEEHSNVSKIERQYFREKSSEVSDDVFAQTSASSFRDSERFRSNSRQPSHYENVRDSGSNTKKEQPQYYNITTQTASSLISSTNQEPGRPPRTPKKRSSNLSKTRLIMDSHTPKQGSATSSTEDISVHHPNISTTNLVPSPSHKNGAAFRQETSNLQNSSFRKNISTAESVLFPTKAAEEASSFSPKKNRKFGLEKPPGANNFSSLKQQLDMNLQFRKNHLADSAEEEQPEYSNVTHQNSSLQGSKVASFRIRDAEEVPNRKEKQPKYSNIAHPSSSSGRPENIAFPEKEDLSLSPKKNRKFGSEKSPGVNNFSSFKHQLDTNFQLRQSHSASSGEEEQPEYSNIAHPSSSSGRSENISFPGKEEVSQKNNFQNSFKKRLELTLKSRKNHPSTSQEEQSDVTALQDFQEVPPALPERNSGFGQKISTEKTIPIIVLPDSESNMPHYIPMNKYSMFVEKDAGSYGENFQDYDEPTYISSASDEETISSTTKGKKQPQFSNTQHLPDDIEFHEPVRDSFLSLKSGEYIDDDFDDDFDDDDWDDNPQPLPVETLGMNHNIPLMYVLTNKKFESLSWYKIMKDMQLNQLNTINRDQQNLAQVKFDLIKSEWSYLNALKILNEHFVSKLILLLSRNEFLAIFGFVRDVMDCSEIFFKTMEMCWQNSVLLHNFCEIICKHLTNFRVYIDYCSNQAYFENILSEIISDPSRENFREILNMLHNDPICKGLHLHGYLLLPLQKIYSFSKLLVNMEKYIPKEHIENYHCRKAITEINELVEECKRQSKHKMDLLRSSNKLKQLEFPKNMPAVSKMPSRLFIKSGEVEQIEITNALFSKTKIVKKKVFLFLFSDLFVIAKNTGPQKFTVLQYCYRIYLEPVSDLFFVQIKYGQVDNDKTIFLKISHNHEMKENEVVFVTTAKSEKVQWLEALDPPDSAKSHKSLNLEFIKKVIAQRSYTPLQPEELSLTVGDVINVLRETDDGWYFGLQEKDGESGWFQANMVLQVDDIHSRMETQQLTCRKK